MSAEVWAFGEEGVRCPFCGSGCDYDPDGGRPFPVTCLGPSGHQFMGDWADPQCGNCREFLDDPDAEDDSLCPNCATRGTDDEEG